MRWISIFASLLLSTSACTSDGALFPDYTPAPAIEPWEENPQYWAWEGSDPVLLLGLKLRWLPINERYYEEILNDMEAAGANFITINVGSYKTLVNEDAPDSDGRQEKGPMRPEEYWRQLDRVLNDASNRGFVIQLIGYDLLESCCAASLDFLKKYDNLLLGNSGKPVRANEQNDGEATGGTNGLNSNVDFFRQILRGDPVATVRLRPMAEIGQSATEVYQQGLNSIRAVRNVERTVKFWELTPAPELLIDNGDDLAFATKDVRDNYVIHLGGVGSVQVRLKTENQEPIKVTVIGKLGTRRSETLLPPYGSVFELSSEDSAGAWLLMERL